MKQVIILTLLNDVVVWGILQIEIPEQKGLGWLIIAALGGTITALAIYIKQQNKEIKEAYKNSAEEIKESNRKSNEEIRALTSGFNEHWARVVDGNTKAMIENTHQTQRLTELIRDKLLK